MASPSLFQFHFPVMACEGELQLYADDAETAQSIAKQAIAEVRRIESRYSRYQSDSVVSQINRMAGKAPVLIDAETALLLDYADACFRQSGGRFDITAGVLRKAWDFSRSALPDATHLRALLPLIGWQTVQRSQHSVYLPQAGMELDFGGFGKEYAVDQAADLCLRLGVKHGLLNLGGDLRVIGPQVDGSPWQVGIRHPRDPDVTMASLPVSEGALATSGDYERYLEHDGRRYCHILHPQTGYPVQGWQSVSVFAPRCLLAGSVSTMTMLLDGPSGEAWLVETGLPVLAIKANGDVLNRFAAA